MASILKIEIILYKNKIWFGGCDSPTLLHSGVKMGLPEELTVDGPCSLTVQQGHLLNDHLLAFLECIPCTRYEAGDFLSFKDEETEAGLRLLIWGGRGRGETLSWAPSATLCDPGQRWGQEQGPALRQLGDEDGFSCRGLSTVPDHQETQHLSALSVSPGAFQAT